MAIPREVGKQKKLTNTRLLRLFKEKLSLTQLQKDFLFGTMLGDGCLITSRSEKSALLQVRQSVKQKEYVLWKYSLFKGWALTQPREDIHNQSFYFRTVSHPDLMKIKRLFYKGSKRFVPDNISQLLTKPISLAVWAMDDGNGSKTRCCYRISSYGFGELGNVLLQECLERNFSLQTDLYRDQKGFYIYFSKPSAIELYTIIKPFILPCMQYKFASLTP